MIWLFVSFFSFVFSQPQLADGVIAVVGNQIVLLSDIKDETDLISKEKNISPNSSLYVKVFESVLEKNINNNLKQEGFEKVKITTVLSPAWTTEWMSEKGMTRLREYGIAPPNPTSPDEVSCPQCGSENTLLVSQFGSTACKSLYKCNDCLEPFDYFKCH